MFGIYELNSLEVHKLMNLLIMTSSRFFKGLLFFQPEKNELKHLHHLICHVCNFSVDVVHMSELHLTLLCILPLLVTRLYGVLSEVFFITLIQKILSWVSFENKLKAFLQMSYLNLCAIWHKFDWVSYNPESHS